jgi:glycosyltransferase involved in cell wall biosynthesis
VHIAFLAWRDLPHPRAGGSELMVDQLALGLQQLGHRVSLASGGPTGEHPYASVQLGGTYSQYLRAPIVFHRHLRDADVVVDVANGIPFFSPLWDRRPTICLMTHVHVAQWMQHFAPPVAAVGRTLERVAVPLVYSRTRFAAISASTAKELEDLGVDPRAISVLNLGIHPPRREWRPSPTPLFVAVGRLVPQKRVDLILAAWERVRPVFGGRLVVIGNGSELGSLRERAGEAVEFTGGIPDDERERLVGSAWLLIHAAQHEGWGMVVMEAAVAGVPALAFDAPGVRDSIVHGRTGVLVSRFDDFVDEWIALGRDGPRRASLGAAARARAAGYTWSAAAGRLAALARSACGPSGAFDGAATLA